MKGKKIAALLMAAVLLMAAMTGCSGSGDNGDVYKRQVQGTGRVCFGRLVIGWKEAGSSRGADE